MAHQAVQWAGAPSAGRRPLGGGGRAHMPLSLTCPPFGSSLPQLLLSISGTDSVQGFKSTAPRRPSSGLPSLPRPPAALAASPCRLTARLRSEERRWPSRRARRARRVPLPPQEAWEPSAWSRRPRASAGGVGGAAEGRSRLGQAAVRGRLPSGVRRSYQSLCPSAVPLPVPSRLNACASPTTRRPLWGVREGRRRRRRCRHGGRRPRPRHQARCVGPPGAGVWDGALCCRPGPACARPPAVQWQGA